jgi:glycogen(starch) synthase
VAGRAPTGDDDLRAQAAGLPVEFVGFVNPAEFLAGIDMLIVPSIWQEPFGLTIVEAYAAGVPVIGADSGGVAEIIRAVDPNSLVRANDAAALAARMNALLSAGLQALPRPDTSGVLARTAPEHVVDEYLRVYGQALQD